MKRWLNAFMVALGIGTALFGGSLLFAQSTELTGTILDPQGRAVSGASMVIRNEETGVKTQIMSNEAGSYALPAIQPGRYTVSISRAGFETLVQRGLQLDVATTRRMNFQLALGHQTDSVEVNAGSDPLDTSSAELATVITRHQYDELPLVQQGRIRSPAAFIYLAPGVQGNYTAAGLENTSATNQFVINGSQMQVGQFYLSGLPVGQMRTVGSYNESAPPVDAVGEFKIITDLVPAEYGHTGPVAGVFEIRSGADSYHASIYEYFRNNALDAQPWGTITPLFTHQNEFGATFGGPFVLPRVYDGHRKTFFFLSFGGSRKDGADSVQQLHIPTPQEISGDFSGQQTIYDPATTRLNAAGTGYIRDPFPDNKIPSYRIRNFAKAVAQYYPAPNITGTNNYQAFKGEKLLDPDTYTVRVDHHLTDDQHLYATFIHTNIPRHRVDTALPLPLQSMLNQDVQGTTAHLNHDWAFGSNKLNSAAIGYYRFANPLQPAPGNQFAVPGQLGTVLPEMTFTNGYAGLLTDIGSNDVEDDLLASDSFSWSIGKHTLRLGGSFTSVHFNDNSPQPASNVVAFSNLETASPSNTSKTGDAFASFLLGQVDSGTITAPTEIATRYRYWGVYAQDDWKVTQRLTVNAGLRWEVQTVPRENGNKSSIVDLSAPNLSAGNIPGALIFAGGGSGRSGMQSFASNDYSAIGPRVGFSYLLLPQMTVRAGYGVYYSDLGLSISASGFQPSATYASPNSGISPAFDIDAGFPGSPSLHPNLSATLLNGQNATFLASSSAAMPRIQSWNGGIQYAPGRQWTIEADYVGNHGTRLLDTQMSNINQVNPSYLSLGSVLTIPATSAAATAAGIQLPYPGFSGTVAQALRAFPQYKTLTSMGAKDGYSNYNALQLIVEKRMGWGLSVGGNYTWSKTLGVSSPSTYGGGVISNVLQNAYDPQAEYSILPLDVRNAVVLHYVYELPFGKDRALLSGVSGAIEPIISGWKISGIQRYQSGFPLPILTANSLPIFNTILRPNVVPGVKRSGLTSPNAFQPASSRIINPAAFSVPAAYTLGDASPTYSDIREFPIYDEDLSLLKETKLSERLTWNLYVQAFNSLNRHRFGTFDTTLTDATFGESSAVSEPRYVQLGTRFEF